MKRTRTPFKLKRNSLMVTLPLAGITALYVWYVYLPLRRTIADLRQQCTHHEQMLAHAQTLGGTIGIRQQELEECKAFAQKHLGGLPEAQEAVDTLGEIALLADQAGAKMERFEPAPVEKLEFLARVPVNLTCAGDFERLFNFLARLESMPRKLWIEDLHIEAPREIGQKARCELKLVVFAKRSGNSD